MNQSNKASEYRRISSMKELRFQRKLLSSRVENQEAMIMYKIQMIKENVSPGRLIYMGLEAAASRNSVVRKFKNTIDNIGFGL